MYEKAMKHMDNEGSVTRILLPSLRLVIHLCGQSRRKHVAVIIMAALMGNRIITYWRTALLLRTQKWDGAEMFRLI